MLGHWRAFGPFLVLLLAFLFIPAASLPAFADDEEEITPTPAPTVTPPRTTPVAPTPTQARSGGPSPTPTPSATPEPAVPTPTPTPQPTRPTPTPSPPIYPLAVMVDNFPAARPQTGLGAADIVYEALAEGGITRFLAIYTAPDPGMVGPVRSARHYYVYWAAEYNAPIVHILASDEGYAALVNTGLPDLDEHRGDPGFQRSPERPMPYNAYTGPAFDRQILAANGALWPGSRGGLERQPPARFSRGTRVDQFGITYPLAGFQVDWSFDRAPRRYVRSQAGAPHLDAATGQPIVATTVVVQFVRTWELVYRGGETYLDMQQIGAGRAVYFENGLAVEGSWFRPSLGDFTRYLAADGSAFAFRPGPIWVQVVPTGPLEGSLTYAPLRPR